MVLLNHIPANGLATYVDHFIYFDNLSTSHNIERVIPTGNIFIVFELDGYTRHTFDNETLQPNGSYTKAWVSGAHRSYLSISTHSNSSMFVIQLKPIGSYPLFQFSIDKLTENVLPAGAVLGDDIYELREELITTPTPEQKFALAEKWLSEKIDVIKAVPVELLDIVSKIQTAPAAQLNDIIHTYPNTPKHLISQFKKYIGLTPKYYQRILRFNDILKKIEQKEKIAWTDIAYTCGYSDQSHFIKEFRHFSGFNPSEFIEKEYNTTTNFFPLDTSG